jgi:uncharacterized protein (DUF983 family)
MRAARRFGWKSLLRQRCPVCQRGAIFRGALAMNDDCPVCGLHFEREPGYFLGALYVSYFLSIVVLGVFMLVGALTWPRLDLGLVVLVAAVAYLPLVPLVFRYSRVLWIHFDRWFAPEASEEDGP